MKKFFKIFCKGSPETIRKLCIKRTIPINFEEILNFYTNKGYRVMAFAGKIIDINIQQSQTLTRGQVEKNMIFLGFCIFENKLKEKRKELIELFYKADLSMKMVTGDNLRTSIRVSKECSLIQQNQDIIICDVENINKKLIIKWTKLEKLQNDNIINNNPKSNEFQDYSENDLLNNSPKSLIELFVPERFDYYQQENNQLKKYKRKFEVFKVTFNKSFRCLKSRIKNFLFSEVINDNQDVPLSLTEDENFVIAISGTTFEYLHIINQRYIKDKNPSLKIIHDIFRLVLKNGKVFARMTPENKLALVKSLIDEGFTTLMCGDGSNDCLALKAADVSVSLSLHRISLAGDFYTEVKDISCIHEILKEGKCSLATSLQTFKYMMMYSFIQSICSLLIAANNSFLTDKQYLISDLFFIFPLEFLFAMSKPYEKLSHHYPIYNLLSFPIVLSIIFHFLFVFSFQIGGYKILKHHYKWERICDFDEDDEPLACHENTIILLISLFQFPGSAISFLVSKPLRERIFKNWILTIYLTGTYFYIIWITINCDSWSRKIFNLYKLEKKNIYENDEEIKEGKKIKYFVFLIVLINTFCSIFFEWVIMRFIRKCYENKIIENHRKEIFKNKNEQKNNDKIKDVKIYKYNKVYWYDKRLKKRNKSQ